jgi:hypothetical protein
LKFTFWPGVRGPGHRVREHIYGKFFINLLRTFRNDFRIQANCGGNPHPELDEIKQPAVRGWDRGRVLELLKLRCTVVNCVEAQRME